MRLPWPLGRRSSPTAPGAHDGAAPSGETPTPGSARPGGSEAPPTGAWASLPPIQRTAGDPPLVAPSAPFLADVPGHQPLPPIVGRLGHDAAPAAPAGLVVAHATPVPALTSGTPLTPRPVQRQAADATTPMAAGAAGTPDTGTGGGPGPVPAAAAPDLPAAPVRHLAVVSPGATVTPSPQPLTATPPRLVPAGGRRPPTPAPAPALSESPSTPAHATPSEAPAVARRWSEATGPSQAASEPPAARPPGRRPGLGAPLASAPSTVAQRQATGPSTSPGPALSAVSARRSPLSGPSATSSPPAGPQDGAAAPAPSASAQSPAPRPLPLLPVVARHPAPAGTEAVAMAADTARGDPSEPAGPPAAASAGQAPQGPEAPQSGSPMPQAALARPRAVRQPHAARTVQREARATVGARPLRPALAPLVPPASRSATAAAGPGDAGPGEPVPARWTPGPTIPAVVTSAAPARSTLAGAATLSGPSAPAGRATGGPASVQHAVSPSASEIVFPPLGQAELPGWATAPVAPPFEVQRSPAASPRPPAEGPGLSLARPRQAPTAAPASAPAITWSADVATPPPAGTIVAAPEPTTVQASRGAPATAVPVTATPVVQRVDGTAPTPPATPPEHSEAELDELARSLFGRIRSQLRTDVLNDREARGLPFDAF